MEAIYAGRIGIGAAAVEGGSDAEREPVVWVDVADEIETLAAVGIGASPLGGRVVLILRIEENAACIVPIAGQRVLGSSPEPPAYAPLKGEIERVEDSAAKTNPKYQRPEPIFTT